MAENQQQGRQQQGSSPSNRGFAAMDDDKQREIASKGGSSVDAEDRSFSKDRQLAAEAGQKGGQASHGGGGESPQGGEDAGAGRGGNFADDPERAAEAGRKGGER
jgi:general stress protein YciG